MRPLTSENDRRYGFPKSRKAATAPLARKMIAGPQRGTGPIRDTDPPEDIAANGRARTEWSNGVLQLVAVAEKIGGTLDPKWVVEDAQKQGVRFIMPTLPDVEDEGAEDDLPTPGYAERIALKLNELQAGKCQHDHPISCVHCGIRREDEPMRADDGAIVWQIHWVPRDLTNTQSQTPPAANEIPNATP